MSAVYIPLQFLQGVVFTANTVEEEKNFASPFLEANAVIKIQSKEGLSANEVHR